MRKTIAGLLLASSIIAQPALARDGQMYGGISGGVLFGDNLEIDYDFDGDDDISDDETEVAVVETDTGFDVDAVLGYDFGMFRLEGEAAYKRAGLDVVSFGEGVDDDDFPELPDGSELRGNVNAKSLMVNALVDLGDDDGAQFFAGGGLGYAWVGLDGAIGDNDDDVVEEFFDDDHGGLAWQALAGVRFPMSENIDLGLKYRYFNVEDIELFASNDDRFETDFQSHSVLATLLFNFGGQSAPPAPVYTPPPPVQAPPPPQMQTCWNGARIPVTQICPAQPPAPSPQGERG